MSAMGCRLVLVTGVLVVYGLHSNNPPPAAVYDCLDLPSSLSSRLVDRRAAASAPAPASAPAAPAAAAGAGVLRRVLPSSGGFQAADDGVHSRPAGYYRSLELGIACETVVRRWSCIHTPRQRQ